VATFRWGVDCTLGIFERKISKTPTPYQSLRRAAPKKSLVACWLSVAKRDYHPNVFQTFFTQGCYHLNAWYPMLQTGLSSNQVCCPIYIGLAVEKEQKKSHTTTKSVSNCWDIFFKQRVHPCGNFSDTSGFKPRIGKFQRIDRPRFRGSYSY
jgi:hypothetical protein